MVNNDIDLTLHGIFIGQSNHSELLLTSQREYHKNNISKSNLVKDWFYLDLIPFFKHLIQRHDFLIDKNNQYENYQNSEEYYETMYNLIGNSKIYELYYRACFSTYNEDICDSCGVNLNYFNSSNYSYLCDKCGQPTYTSYKL